MSTQTMRDGGTALKDPYDEVVKVFDWDRDELATGVEIAAYSVEISGGDGQLTAGSPTLLAGNRKVQVQVAGGTAGQTYTLSNKITTNESPAQKFKRSITVSVQNL